MSEIVKRVFFQGETRLPDDVKFIEKEIQIPQTQKIPLYPKGICLDAEALAALGLTVREYTAEELEAETFSDYYEANPTLAERVRQYVAILTAYGLGADATSDEIRAAIMSDSGKSDAEKTSSAASLLALVHDIELNYNEVNPGAGLEAWSTLPKLIRYLPASETAEG